MSIKRYAEKGFIAVLIASAAPALAQNPENSAAPAISYAYLADLSIASPIIADVTITQASRIKPINAPGLLEGSTRFLVQARVNALVRGDSGLPPLVTYLVDLSVPANHKLPKLKGQQVLIFAAQVEGKPDTLRLIARGAQFAWADALVSEVRGIVRDVLAPNAPPQIVAVGDAFHVPGSLPGESETQIFLKTVDKRPVSLSILRRPGEQPTWALALGDMVDESAATPKRDSLLWYRLACFLPAALPEKSVEKLSPDDAVASATDYRLVVDSLGPCDRTPPNP